MEESPALAPIEIALLDKVVGGFSTEGMRLSNNVEDRRGQYIPSEDGTLYDTYSGKVIDDPTINQDPGGWRDDQETGDRTWIDGDGNTTSVEHRDGSFSYPNGNAGSESSGYGNFGGGGSNEGGYGNFGGGGASAGGGGEF